MTGGPHDGSAPGAQGLFPRRRGLGGLLTTEFDRVPLGEHRGRLLHGHVERRVLRLATGGRIQLSLTLGRSRATAVEIEDGDGTRLLAIPPVADPWLTMLRRTALLWACSLLLTAAVGRLLSLLRPATGAGTGSAGTASEGAASDGSLAAGGVTGTAAPVA